ncbi:MAG: ATP-binding protein [Methanomassiliicoccus sp.]|nr:ATP-binding protein [Methanomassiliicoccus sp.]
MSLIGSKVFEASLERLEEVLAFIGPLISEALRSEERMTDLLVAAEEAFTNVAEHAYDGPGSVEVSVEVEGMAIYLTFRDHGKPFDPLNVPPPNLNEAPEGRVVGGLGIHLMRSLVDDVRYCREAGTNVLVMVMGTANNNIS